MVRTIRHNGEEWVSVNDLRAAMNNDELILKAAAMLKVATVKHHDGACEAIRRVIGYFFTEATGALRHTEN